MNTREKGDKAEEIAVKYLVDKGYSIKKRNFSFGKIGELDIIAEKDDTLVFVEVKYLKSLNKRSCINSRVSLKGICMFR